MVQNTGTVSPRPAVRCRDHCPVEAAKHVNQFLNRFSSFTHYPFRSKTEIRQDRNQKHNPSMPIAEVLQVSSVPSNNDKMDQAEDLPIGKEIFHMLGRLSAFDFLSETEMDFEGFRAGSNNSSSSRDSEDNSSGDSCLPPPKPFYVRRHEPGPANLPLQRAISLPSSGTDTSRPRIMTHSLPNLHTSRATHNRVLGLCLPSDSPRCGYVPATAKGHSRAEEFDILLEGL